MNRYVIARVSSPPHAPATSLAPATPAAEIIEVREVDRHAFFRICFRLVRNVRPPPRPRSAASSFQAVQP